MPALACGPTVDSAILYVEYLAHTKYGCQNLVQHKLRNREKVLYLKVENPDPKKRELKPVRVDGYLEYYDQGSNLHKVVIEFKTCGFEKDGGHGCCPIHAKFNTTNKKFKDDFNNTLVRTENLLKNGFEVEEIFSCQFWELIAKDDNFETFANAVRHKYGPNIEYREKIESEILEELLTDESHISFVYCDLKMKPEFREKWEDLPPLIRKSTVKFDQLSEYQKKHAKLFNVSSKFPQTRVLATYSGKRILISTPYLKYLVKIGFEVSQITDVLTFKSAPFFRPFAIDKNTKRKNSVSSLENSMYKTLVNAFFGVSLTNYA